jgi:hypothetical protein
LRAYWERSRANYPEKPINILKETVPVGSPLWNAARKEVSMMQQAHSPLCLPGAFCRTWNCGMGCDDLRRTFSWFGILFPFLHSSKAKTDQAPQLALMAMTLNWELVINGEEPFKIQPLQ